MLEKDGILESLLFEWEKFNSVHHQNEKLEQSSKSKPSHQIKQQWSMVIIRDSLHRSDLSIFPPVNHENLHRQIQHHQQQQQQQQNPVPESSLLPHPDAGGLIQSSGDHGIVAWLGTLLQILRAKIVSLAGYFGYENGGIRRAFGSFRGVVDVAVVVLLWWLCKRIRRRRCGKEESVEQLKRIIREKDEKIVGLLNQIARMNASIGSTS